MPWKPHRLRESEVWARVDGDGALVADADGRVEVVYKAAAGAKVYRAGARNLAATSGPVVDFQAGEPAPQKESAGPAATPGKPARASASSVPADAIQVWTDGACSGNPGPAGLGAVIIDGAEEQELSEFIGDATNQIAELMAIFRGLEVIPTEKRARPVYVHSDSAYSIGLLSQNWKAKANVELVTKIRALTKQFANLNFVKVAGHAGVPLNERVDELARGAVSRRR